MTTKTTTITIRIDTDLKEWLKKRDSRLIMESACELIQTGRLVYTQDGLKVNAAQGRLEDINLLVEFSGGNIEDFLDDLWGKLNEGTIELENGKIAKGVYT